MNANFLSTSSSPYQTPSFLSYISPSILPTHKLSLGRFPTPIHEFNIPMDLHGPIQHATHIFMHCFLLITAFIFRKLLSGLECWIKRDDTSSFDLSGNKVRKLEFLLAEAIRGKHDCVITIGYNMRILYIMNEV